MENAEDEGDDEKEGGCDDGAVESHFHIHHHPGFLLCMLKENLEI